MQSTPEIPKLGATSMQVDTELEMPLDIPISTRTTTTDSAPGKASLDVTQLDDTHATPSEPDQHAREPSDWHGPIYKQESTKEI